MSCAAAVLGALPIAITPLPGTANRVASFMLVAVLFGLLMLSRSAQFGLCSKLTVVTLVGFCHVYAVLLRDTPRQAAFALLWTLLGVVVSSALLEFKHTVVVSFANFVSVLALQATVIQPVAADAAFTLAFVLIVTALVDTVAWIGHRDRSEIEFSHRRLAEARSRTQAILDGSPAAVLTIGETGRITDTNAVFDELFGWRPWESHGKLAYELIVPEADRLRAKDVLDNLAQGNSPHAGVVHKALGLTKRGSTFPLELTLALVRADEDTEYVCYLNDVTDKEKLQARLLLADKMVSLGSLVAGVAHEINNPLTFVKSNLDLIAERRTTQADDASAFEFTAELADAREGCNRIRDIVGDLQIFSRFDEVSRSPIDLVKVLEASLSLTWNEVRHRALVVRDFRPVPIVFANKSRLGQVFINLMVNAAQAVPLGSSRENQVCVRCRTDAATGAAVVEVEDSGAGMTSETLARAFEPFFTTKPAGSGTGLGLSICHTIIKDELEGTIEAESVVGKGTLMRVTIPPAPQSASFDAAPVRELEKAQKEKGRARVLVIEDDTLVSTAVGRILAAHDVATHTNSQFALRDPDLASHDIILCDVMMPDVTGEEFYHAAKHLHPGIQERIVFMTGGVFAPSVRDFLASISNTVLRKPVDITALRSLVGDRAAMRELQDEQQRAVGHHGDPPAQ